MMSASAQSDLSFGQWEAHLPYQRGISVTQSPTKIYYSTDESIMAVDKADLSLEYISKVEGLSTLGITNVKYDPFSKTLMVLYSDSNIDIMTENGIINIADIKNNTGIIGDKRINNVHFAADQVAYLSLGFGVVSFNMETFEFGFTTQMGLIVNNVTVTEDRQLYAATNDGLYRLDLTQNFNFGDFSNWELIGSESGLPVLYEANDIAYYQESLFLQIGNAIYREEAGQFTSFFQANEGEQVMFMNADDRNLMIGIGKETAFQSWINYVNENFEIVEGTKDCANFITYAVQEESGRVWYSDQWNSFRYTDGIDGFCQRFVGPSPKSRNVSELRVKDGKLFVASGGVSDGFNFRDNRDGTYILEDGQWFNHNDSNNDFMKAVEALNIFTIAPDPDSDFVFLGSFFSGLIKANFITGEYKIYNNENSPVSGTAGTPFIEKVSGLDFDERKNLWISVYEGENPLIAMTPEGTFHSMPINASNRIGQIEIDDSGYIWVQLTGASGGILVYDDGGTVKDPSDDRQRVINSSRSNLQSNLINCLTMDLDGDMWVGTSAGPIVFECGGDPFDEENCLGSIRKVLEDSIPANLLVTEDMRAIAMDGANNKWFGSRNGIFVQSSDGREKVARFTIDNSPLFNNNIIDMTFDPESGIMYIANDGGIQAFKTTTTEGGRRHQSNTFAYPNPVRPDYEGLIAIRGLARDATVKITDIRGQLVHEGEAEGGQATWDGRDYNGRKVSSGVYLVFTNSRDFLEDPNTAVTKLLIVR